MPLGAEIFLMEDTMLLVINIYYFLENNPHYHRHVTRVDIPNIKFAQRLSNNEDEEQYNVYVMTQHTHYTDDQSNSMQVHFDCSGEDWGIIINGPNGFDTQYYVGHNLPILQLDVITDRIRVLTGHEFAPIQELNDGPWGPYAIGAMAFAQHLQENEENDADPMNMEGGGIRKHTKLQALQVLAKKHPFTKHVGYMWKNPFSKTSRGIRWTRSDLDVFRKLQKKYQKLI